jgi:hypothetical protein
MNDVASGSFTDSDPDNGDRDSLAMDTRSNFTPLNAREYFITHDISDVVQTLKTD